MTNKRFAPAAALAALFSTASIHAQNLDTKPAFMQIVTNVVVKTNVVITTNYVAVTNAVVTTNLYNAAGQLLTPVNPPIPGLIPIPQPAVPTVAAANPAAVKAAQLQAVRDLLTQGLQETSAKLGAAGTFTSNVTYQIALPQGLTAFDRKKTQTLLTAMNATAEKALPEAMALFTKSVPLVTTDDPAAVLQGEKDAASRLLITLQGDALNGGVLAAVQKAGSEFKLRESYSAVMLKGGGLLGSVLGTGPTVDIESHVTQGLLKAIINQLAEREGVIRTDPAARKTKSVQDAFKK